MPYGAKIRMESYKKDKARMRFPGVTRDLPWMSGDVKGTRNFAVTNLYPRLLYTFSDVVVFVVRNEKYCLLPLFSEYP